jgi:hypothetical protein
MTEVYKATGSNYLGDASLLTAWATEGMQEIFDMIRYSGIVYDWVSIYTNLCIFLSPYTSAHHICDIQTKRFARNMGGYGTPLHFDLCVELKTFQQQDYVLSLTNLTHIHTRLCPLLISIWFYVTDLKFASITYVIAVIDIFLDTRYSQRDRSWCMGHLRQGESLHHWPADGSLSLVRTSIQYLSRIYIHSETRMKIRICNPML